ncbi:hypothetical protein QRX60_36220 [Amycolatopsis mongoliensis]|uniref:Uncharacterized protein n=1 Tax=Amycolatopsis mongoliensis TaxID=715475 RepID=A0A9Y2NBB5_9PSEU|nr:hypothetical protein [Amycolatopsis sp. 4-36]WIX99460.1 hypothetical protein QRX60_36220 [Amycolatopsis sp. 4-36]
MSMKNDGSAGSALASPVRPAVVATTMPPTASARAMPPVAIFVRRVMRCLPVAGDRDGFRAMFTSFGFPGTPKTAACPGETRGTRGSATAAAEVGDRGRFHWFRHWLKRPGEEAGSPLRARVIVSLFMESEGSSRPSV